MKYRSLVMSNVFMFCYTLQNSLCSKILLLVIRVMDDVKDFEKDKIVHPERYLLDHRGSS